MASSRSFGFGVVGLGVIADFHARAIQDMRGGHLACLFSNSGGNNAKALARRCGVELYAGDYDAFLQHSDLDVVVIATPSGIHLEPVVAAAKAGKHVVCEKPLEITLERCSQMIRACKRAGVQLGGIFQSRTGAAVQAIKRALDAGRFGKLTVCNAIIPWHRTQAYYDSGAWRGTWELDGGGALMNQSIHTIDLLQWLAGPIRSVHALAGNLAHKRIDVEDTAVAVVRYKSGALGTIIGSTAVWPGWPNEIHIVGTGGSACLRGGELVHWDFVDKKSTDARIRRTLGPQSQKTSRWGAGSPTSIGTEGHQLQFENFVRHLRGKAPLLVDGVEARKSVEIILGIYASALSGETVNLPLKRTPERHAFGK
jgi:predicted dehydrogenase